ncbi:sulfite exporter TauE/SafE family protein [uncultured Ferrimonas sp.]|uniref:sulfite exporter TauE/SafE family protein n=1 Tax=uncultured Ferrimonas sp. TaxID=432640 RepID=UPI0026178AA1|nr:sulfite exporter TauE/SafE family protein [uncultured Ferrimonas sp.]
MLIPLLQLACVLTALYFLFNLYQVWRLQPGGWFGPKSIAVAVVGFVANFLDTLGIGSFAIKSAAYKQFKLVDDRLLPGTMNGQCVLATMVQALIFLGVVEVDPLTLLSMIASAVAGAVVGARFVAQLDRQTVRIAMSLSLAVVALLILAGQLQLFPLGGEATGLTGGKLLLAIAANFVWGALMTVGVGIFAPCMTTVYLLGMNPLAAFPIMMASCAMLAPFSASTFVRKQAVDRAAVLAVAITGPIAVLLAAFLVQSLQLDTLKWLVFVVVLWTSFSMFRSYQHERVQ